MNDESRVRLDVARRVVDALSRDVAPAATLLAGSVAQEVADDHSDIDLLNYYSELPEPALFDSVLTELGMERIGAIAAPTADGFSTAYTVDGIQLQTGAQTLASMESRIARIETGDVDWITAKIAMGLLEGMPLRGDALIESWKERAAYTDALRRKEIESNLGVFPVWSLDSHLAARDAELFRRQMLLDGAFRVVGILSALNRLYFTTFQFKRMRAHLDRMVVKPDRLADRLERVADAPPSEAAEELRGLVDETKALVGREMADIRLDVRWQPIAE